jgi:anti-sigma regulatory factor (Ser/Thr protein kinase)
MTSSAAAGQRGFRHELLLHRSTQELVEFVVPMAREGVAAQEPTLLLVRPDTAEAVLHQVGPSPYLTVQPALTEPGRPGLHVRAARPMLAPYARVVHQEPAIPPAHWPQWRRLEAVLNLALSYHDTWAVCAYDRGTLTEEMVADLHATHPLIAQDGSDRHNDRYQHPVDFLRQHRNTAPDPVEHTAPAVELADPSPALARATVARFAHHHRLPAGEVDNLVFATHEAVTNALMHGRPPTVLRLWARPDRVTVTVTDTGPGPPDPLVGLLPPDPLNSRVPGPGPRLGLWLSHQLVDVAHRHDPDGYTIRLAAIHPVDGTD